MGYRTEIPADLDPPARAYVMGVPIKLHATPGKVTTPPPTLGQHTDQVLESLLKMTPARVAKLHAEGAV